MSFRRQIRRQTGVLPAMLAVLALLMQALSPGMAMAAGGSRTMVLCTSAGEKTVSIPDDAAPRSMAAGKCHDCVMAAATTILPPSLDSHPVRYAAVVRHERAQARRDAQPARPPPRPPSCGPPNLS